MVFIQYIVSPFLPGFNIIWFPKQDILYAIIPLMVQQQIQSIFKIAANCILICLSQDLEVMVRVLFFWERMEIQPPFVLKPL